MTKNIRMRTGSDFSGVGAFDQALIRLGIEQEKIFACDMDKFARQTYIHNYGEPDYFPENVYSREIPEKPLDIYMTSPPCQAFSMAGGRKGEKDKRGILFYNSHEFIKKNKPRFFIFENVKGLLSDNGGKTFNRWLDFLGGKSINGNPVIFPDENAVPYHIYHQVLNAKKYGIPQNRERVFIVGIRDDKDNNFNWPKPFPLKKKLKDVLENDVHEKYFLSEKAVSNLIEYDKRNKEKGNGFGTKFHEPENIMSALKTGGGGCDDLIKVRSATKCGYELASEEDSINFSVPNSETRRGRVGKGVAQTLDTVCNQGVMEKGARIVGRNPENPKSRKTGEERKQTLEINENPEITNVLTTVQKDNVVVVGETTNSRIAGWHENENVIGAHRDDTKRSSVSEHIYHKENGILTTIQTAHVPKLISTKIRRLTPRECFRLMDFPDSFTWPVSDSQAYKQAGNSIAVGVLAKIIANLPLQGGN